MNRNPEGKPAHIQRGNLSLIIPVGDVILESFTRRLAGVLRINGFNVNCNGMEHLFYDETRLFLSMESGTLILRFCPRTGEEKLLAFGFADSVDATMQLVLEQLSTLLKYNGPLNSPYEEIEERLIVQRLKELGYL